MPKFWVWVVSLLTGLMVAVLILGLCLMAGILWTEFTLWIGNGG